MSLLDMKMRGKLAPKLHHIGRRNISESLHKFCPSYFPQEFYQLLRERLNPEGIVSIQSGASGWTNLENFTAIINTLKSVFSVVCPYQVYVPSFVDLWGFSTASQRIDPAKLSPKEVDRRISTRLSRKLKSYDGLTHQASFTLPKHLRHQLARTKRIITDKKPIFAY